MDTEALNSHTRREYDDNGRITLEIYESDTVRITDKYLYENEWIIREHENFFLTEDRGFLSVERYREDGSAWLQKMFDLKSGRLESEMRQIETADGCIWHDITYNEDGSITRAVHTTRPVKGGTLEQTIVDGKIEEYTIIKPEVLEL